MSKSHSSVLLFCDIFDVVRHFGVIVIHLVKSILRCFLNIVLLVFCPHHSVWLLWSLVLFPGRLILVSWLLTSSYPLIAWSVTVMSMSMTELLKVCSVIPPRPSHSFSVLIGRFVVLFSEVSDVRWLEFLRVPVLAGLHGTRPPYFFCP